MLRAKIHRATVTDANLEYVGSLTIDLDLMDAAGIAQWEAVLVSDLTNGSRHETYAIAGPRGSGVICANGAAAHLVKPGDKVIVMCFGQFSELEVPNHRPRIVLVDEQNRVAKLLQS
jgi:aspartate 1-decarboxylase